MDPHSQPAPGYTPNPNVQPVQQPNGAILSDKQQYAQQIQSQQIPQQQIPQQQQFQQQQYQQPTQGQGQVMPQPSNYQTAVPLPSLQNYPAPVDCPICGVRQMTAVSEEVGGYTHAWAALCCFCLCLGCIPYMMSSFKNMLHKCGSCGAPLALWHRSGNTQVLAHA